MTKPTEQLPEYYHQWNAEERFDDLKKACNVFRKKRKTCDQLERDIEHETLCSTDHTNAISILGRLVSDLQYRDNDVNEKTSKFIKKYYGLCEIEEHICYNLQKSIETLEKEKRAKFRLVVKLEDDLKKEEEAKEKAWETYRDLDTKYEDQFDKLKEAEKLAQATEAANVDNFINNEYNEIEGEVA